MTRRCAALCRLISFMNDPDAQFAPERLALTEDEGCEAVCAACRGDCVRQLEEVLFELFLVGCRLAVGSGLLALIIREASCCPFLTPSSAAAAAMPSAWPSPALQRGGAPPASSDSVPLLHVSCSVMVSMAEPGERKCLRTTSTQHAQHVCPRGDCAVRVRRGDASAGSGQQHHACCLEASAPSRAHACCLRRAQTLVKARRRVHLDTRNQPKITSQPVSCDTCAIMPSKENKSAPAQRHNVLQQSKHGVGVLSVELGRQAREAPMNAMQVVAQHALCRTIRHCLSHAQHNGLVTRRKLHVTHSFDYNQLLHATRIDTSSDEAPRDEEHQRQRSRALCFVWASVCPRCIQRP